MRTAWLLTVALILGVAVTTGCGSSAGSPAAGNRRIAAPPAGRLYHGVYPGGVTGEEDDITRDDVTSYEHIVGRQVAWVYFSHNWFHGRAFPRRTARWIRELGAVPFIRLMLRSDAEQDHAEPLFNLQAVIDGDFDDDLRAWAQGARDFGTALIVEYGTECNGQWFSWNGVWNGGAATDGFGDPAVPDGPERFVAAYRHIITLMRGEGADNITWVFHVDSGDDPDAAWNRFENYYPGDDVIDWVGVSCYGAQTPLDEWEPESFRRQMNRAYPRLRAMAPGKPVMVLEFGCTAGNPQVDPAEWARAALQDILGGRWPKLAGFSWWNEWWENDENPAHDTTMRVQDIPALARVFAEALAAADNVLDRPLYAL
ncbi:MAG: beta-mannanase [Armatimonadetes bacterium]|nr:beta-mannanase [Armatimonadota bacterium]